MPHNRKPIFVCKVYASLPLPVSLPHSLSPPYHAMRSNTHHVADASSDVPLTLLVLPDCYRRIYQNKDAELYLCDWGFNTAAQRGRGEANPRVRVIGTGDIGGALSSPDS